MRLRVEALGIALALVACAKDDDRSRPTDSGSAVSATALHASGGANAPQHTNAPYVILISLDGFRHDYLRRFPAPNILRVAKSGVRADRMIPVFPTKTFPAHYTIATGMYAEHHGIVGNSFWDPKRQAQYSMSNRAAKEDASWYRGEPIWVTAESQGMVTGDYFFVGADAPIAGVRPTYPGGAEGEVKREERVSGALAWLALPDSTRPHLITLYMNEVDDAGHQFGPTSAEVGQAIARVDSSLGRLLEGVNVFPYKDRVYVIIVSDHGMGSAPKRNIEVLDTLRYPGVRLTQSGPYATLMIEHGGAERSSAVRDSINATLRHGKAYLRQDVPARLHYRADPNIGDIVVIMEPKWMLVAPKDVPTSDGFGHGWDNQNAEMGAIFVAMGPGIRAGQRIEAFESVHVYPFIAHLLGLRANPQIDGRLDVLLPVVSGTR
ncbi:MAG: ectonucleotide pyrophosphatase/phosphodiesterase [Gemmatimonadaceae bacterium]